MLTLHCGTRDLCSRTAAQLWAIGSRAHRTASCVPGLVALGHLGLIPQRGTESTSLALQGRFLATEPPAKSVYNTFNPITQRFFHFGLPMHRFVVVSLLSRV